jgi:hypothetical protein
LSIIQEAKSEVAEDGTVVTNKDAAGMDLRPRLDFQIHPQILICKKNIPHHIKIPVHVWNIKCR